MRNVVPGAAVPATVFVTRNVAHCASRGTGATVASAMPVGGGTVQLLARVTSALRGW